MVKKAKKSKGIKLAGAILETVMAIPLIGAMFIIGFSWLPLIATLVLGIIGVVISCKNKEHITGHVMQIVSGILGFIPFVGWILHVIAALALWTEI